MTVLISRLRSIYKEELFKKNIGSDEGLLQLFLIWKNEDSFRLGWRLWNVTNKSYHWIISSPSNRTMAWLAVGGLKILHYAYYLTLRSNRSCRKTINAFGGGLTWSFKGTMGAIFPGVVMDAARAYGHQLTMSPGLDLKLVKKFW